MGLQSSSRQAIEPQHQVVERRFGFLQVHRIEALGEPAIDWSEKIVGLLSFALIAPQPLCPALPHRFAAFVVRPASV